MNSNSPQAPRYGMVVIAMWILSAPISSSAPSVPRELDMQGVASGYTSPVKIEVRFWDSEAAGSGTQLWPAVPNGEVHDPVELTEAGTFNIHVGSKTSGGIPDSAFTSTTTNEIWVEMTINSTDVLPRVRMVSVPFALKSIYAEQLVIPDSVTSAVTVDSSGTVAVGSDVALATQKDSPSTGTHKGSITLSNYFGVTMKLDAYPDTTTDSGRMTFYEPTKAKESLRLDAWRGTVGGGEIELLDYDESVTIDLSGDAGTGGAISLFDGANPTIVINSASTDGGGAITFFDGDNLKSMVLDGDEGGAGDYHGGGAINLYNGYFNTYANSRTVRISGSDNANGHKEDSSLELYRGDSLACRLHSGRDACAGSLGLFIGACVQNGLHQTVDLRASENGSDGGLLALTSSSSEVWTVVLDGDQTNQGFDGGLIRIRGSNDDNGIRLSASHRNGQAELTMFAPGSGGAIKEAVVIQARDNLGGGSITLKGPMKGDTDISLVGGDKNLGYNGRVSFYDNSGGEVVQIRAGDATVTGGTIELRDSNATTKIGLYANFNNSGIGRITSGQVEVTGADLAEKLPVSEALAPGTVVAIDPRNTGKLCVARGPYDHRVAGVVSGANGLLPGAVLGDVPGQEDTLPIALSGRVWVLCDATTAAILPGDLLTTSDTPGHAMKATDRSRAFASVLGKAMTSLTGGRGLVMVLVSLQ